jgi:DNA-directed RNA polymerase subunit beta'
MENEDSIITGGQAFHDMLSAVNIKEQLGALKKDIHEVKSAAKRDDMVKQIKYLAALDSSGTKPEESFIINHMPVIPPICRPPIQQAGNRIKYPDANKLYQDHMLVNSKLGEAKEFFGDDMLAGERRDLYNGAKAIFGVGEAIKGSSRGEGLKGFLKQIGGEGGPKTGFFQSKILSKKQDFSGRATIYAEPNLGFNEAAVPSEMIWTMYEYHIIRDLVKNGYTYPEAKKAVTARTTAAQASYNKLIKQIPILLNRAPTLMLSNVTAAYPKPIPGKTLGISPLHLSLFAGDYDGDALTVHVPISDEAIVEARKKLLPESHIYDFRKGLGNSLVAPGHEAILGSMHLTEPDHEQKQVHFKTEEEALAALKSGAIKVNTPITIG